jgi:hypothetical protein
MLHKIKSNFKRIYASVSVAVMSGLLLATPVSAANAVPEGVDPTQLGKMADLVLWVARIIIAGFAIPSVIKIANGVSDENPRDRNAGIVGVVACGGIIAATFALRPLIVGS